MKELHKGEISLSVFGNVEIRGGTFPGITVNGKDIAKTVSESLKLDKESYENARFIGRVNLVIECMEEEEEIKNTITEQFNETVSNLAHVEVPQCKISD